MNICKKKHQAIKVFKVELIAGNVYRSVGGNFYTCFRVHGKSTLYISNLKDGIAWSIVDENEYTSDRWTDVTDQYCLQEK